MAADLPFLDLSAPGFSTRGPAVLAARKRSWIAETPYGFAVLQRQQAGQLLRDRRLRQGSHAWPATIGLTGAFADFWSRSIIAMDGANHKHLRRHVQTALNPDWVDAQVPHFRTIADDLAERIGPGPVDFMAAFAAPFAGQAMCHLLGLPLGDWRPVADGARSLGLAMTVDGARHAGTINAAYLSLASIARTLIAGARAGSTGGIAARLTAAFDAAPLGGDQALEDLFVIAIFGGVDTTRAQLGLAVAQLAAHPDLWRNLRADPALIPAAIDEAIRARPTTTWATRETTEEIELDGVRLPRGATVHVLIHAASDGPEHRGDPRSPGPAHFGFGGGGHHCLGHLVARTDMATALAALTARFAGVRAAAPATFLPEVGNTGPTALPLMFG